MALGNQYRAFNFEEALAFMGRHTMAQRGRDSVIFPAPVTTEEWETMMAQRGHGKRVEERVRVAIGSTDIDVLIHVNGPEKDAILQHLTAIVRKAVRAEHGIPEEKGR